MTARTPDDPNALFAPFDRGRAPLILDHAGSLAELRPRWTELLARDRKAAIVSQQTPGLVLLMALVSFVLVVSSPLTFRALLWIGLGLGALAYYTHRRGLALDRRDRLDSRKRELLAALLAEIERRIGPDAAFELHADFRSVREVGTRLITEHAARWTAALPPATEPLTHPWLSLELDDDGVAITVRMRSLYGQQDDRMRLRDDLELELRSPGIEPDSDPSSLGEGGTTELIGQRIDAGHARLAFRGTGSATCEPRETPSLDEDISAALIGWLLGSLWRRIVPEHWRDWKVEGYDQLLTGPALVEHIETARRDL